MPKERSINPAQAQRKADKQKQVAKQKKQIQTQRNEKLARRNPDRLQRQIDDLKALESSGALRPKDRETLQQLERDLKGIKRAREALGDGAPKFGSGRQGGDGGVRQEQEARRQAHSLGKRRRGSDEAMSGDSGEETDPDVRTIPMPRDTPPPIPREYFSSGRPGQANARQSVESKPLPPAQTVYSSAPQLRDLKKEAVKFMPSAVAQHKRLAKGQGRLLEPEEVDKLEKTGYRDAQKAAEAAVEEAEHEQKMTEARALGPSARGADLDEEAKRFEAEIANIYPEDSLKIEARPGRVGLEEVQDEGD